LEPDERHRSSPGVLKKLDVGSRAEAAALALTAGISAPG
jgi:hypothetical protein